MTTTSFSKAARDYHHHAHVQRDLAAWLAEWLPSERIGRVLEVGAGSGVFTKHLTGWPGGVIATDLSPEMVAVGRGAVPSASWQVMAAGQPLLGPWNWLVSSAMLQWAEEPTDIFSAWRAVLAPGGRALGALFAAGSLPEWRVVAGDDGPVRWRTPAVWRAALARAGLSVVRDETTERIFYHSSACEFLRSLHGVGAAPERRLTAGALRRRLANYDKSFREPGGRVAATWVFYRFEAAATSST